MIMVISLSLNSTVYAQRGEVKQLDIKYTAIIKDIPKDAKVIQIWLPYPRSDRYQEVLGIKIDSPHAASVHYDPEYGNSFLYIKISNPKEKEIRFTMYILADRYQAINNIEAEKVGELDENLSQYEIYLKPNQYKVVNEDVKKIAHDLTKDKKTYYERVKAIYDYVYDNMKYDKSVPGFGKGDVVRACSVKAGNCIDFHSLFSAIATASGIPSREVSNFDLPFGEVAPNYCKVGFHCSIEVYMPNYGWIPLDISHAKKGVGSKEFYFGSLDNFRLQIGYGRDIQFSPPQNGPRLNLVTSEPYVEIDGIPYENIGKDLLYKDRNLVGAKS
jgi:transglutaminase-like putative cysteine protease